MWVDVYFYKNKFEVNEILKFIIEKRLYKSTLYCCNIYYIIVIVDCCMFTIWMMEF
jgi:hypothetical protein